MNLRTLVCCPLLAVLLATASASADVAMPPAGAAAPAAPAAAEDATLAAREHFAQATKLYKDGDFDAALVQFERAYELKPNYRVLYNIGQSYFQLREYVEAHDAMTRYVKEGGDQIATDRLAAVSKDLADLERRLATVTLTVNVNGATVLIDGKNVGVTPLSEPIVVSEGQRAISVEAPNRAALQRQIRVAGGDQQTLTLAFEQAPQTVIVKAPPQAIKPRLGAGFWSTAISAVALGAGAGVTGNFAFQAQDDNRRQVKQLGTTQAQLDDSNKRAKTLALTTDILAGTAVVCAGIAVVILITSPSRHSTQVGLSVGPGSAMLSGRF